MRINRGYPILLTGYIGWGLFPLYWALLSQVPALEVLLHRMLWAVPVLALLVGISPRRRSQFRAAWANWRELRYLCASGLLISFNWGIYIWAVANQQVIEASMGYFLTPLLNVVAGVLLFRERIATLQWIAIGCAALGVIYYVASAGVIPWVSFAVALSFSTYGLLRKKMATNAIPGLFIETLLLLPVTLSLMLWFQFSGTAWFLNYSRLTDLWLILGGPITVLPLAFFTAGTRMLPMITVGVLFFVTPTLQFLCGVFILGESFSQDQLIGFSAIWIGLALFSYSLLTRQAEVSAEVV